jgi:opacity protein-like surface antigen
MKTLRFGLALVAAAAIGLPSQLGAQTVIGAKAGINLANVSFSYGDLSASADSRTGFVGGAFAQFGLGSPLFIQPEVLYSSKGSKASDDFGESFELSLDYLEIPILLGAAFPIENSALKPMIFAGPSVGFLLSCDSDGLDCKDETKSVDFGLAFGGGIQYALENLSLFLDGRYNLSLTNADDTEDSLDISAKNRAWQFMAGVGFPVGG